jgi:hypothetical protein
MKRLHELFASTSVLVSGHFTQILVRCFRRASRSHQCDCWTLSAGLSAHARTAGRLVQTSNLTRVTSCRCGHTGRHNFEMPIA